MIGASPLGMHRRAALSRLAGAAAIAFGLAACAEAPAPPPAADAVPGPGLYQIPPGTPVDGTLRLTIARGTPGARGTLSTNGIRIPVVLQGLSVAAPAPARVEITGEVFGLGRTDQFFAPYRDVGASAAAAGVDLTGGLQLGNDNLVVIRLRPAVEGQVLTASPQGVTPNRGR